MVSMFCVFLESHVQQMWIEGYSGEGECQASVCPDVLQ